MLITVLYVVCHTHQLKRNLSRLGILFEISYCNDILTILFYSDDKLVKVWDWERAETEYELTGHLNEVLKPLIYC